MGRDGWYPAQSLRSDLSMIRPIFTEIALFVTPFVLYAVFLWATKAGVMDLNSWPLVRVATLAIAATGAGTRQLHLLRAFFRRAAWLHLRAGAHWKRQIRAGDHEIMSSQEGRTDRKLSDAPWLTAGAAAAAARRARLRGRGSARGRWRRPQRIAGHADRGNRRGHDRRAGRSHQSA